MSENKHACPSKCHKCPLLHGDVMPGCMGTAALAVNAHDLSHCTCSHHPHSVPGDQLSEMQARILRLEERVFGREVSRQQ